MRKFLLSWLLVCAVAVPILLSTASYAEEGQLDPSPPKGITVEALIQRFADKEKEFMQARDQYTYRQSVKVQTLEGDTVDGEYQEVFDVVFDDQGRRLENVVFAPQTSLQRISMTPEDIDDIRHRLPFVLTSDEIGEYNILYVGQQQEDELHCYVFDIAPKEIVGWTIMTFRSLKLTARPFLTFVKRKTTKICSPNSPPGGNRSTTNTGSQPIPKLTTPSIFLPVTCAFARS